MIYIYIYIYIYIIYIYIYTANVARDQIDLTLVIIQIESNVIEQN